MIFQIRRKIVDTLKKHLPEDSDLRWVLSMGYHYPFRWPLAIAKSLYATFRLTGKPVPVRVRIPPHLILRIKRSQHSNIDIKGNIVVEPWSESNINSSIKIGENATFKVLGDFIIGPNVHINIGKNATLMLGGKKESTGSGITADSKILVEKFVSVGFDCIVAWNVFISDSDWHDIENKERTGPVVIEDHVWIAHDCSILRNSHIPRGCIVGAKSMVNQGGFEENSLIAGCPAKIKKSGIKWRR